MASDDTMIARAKVRFKEVLAQHKPDKVLVFSNTEGKKGWSTLPETDEKARSENLRHLPIPKFVKWGTYRLGHHTVMAFGLRHPQFAKSDDMQRAVREILSIPTIRAALVG